MKNEFIYDYSKLVGQIIDKCGTQENFARLMGLSPRTISLKLNNKINFRQSEIEKAISILKLSKNQISVLFFTHSDITERAVAKLEG